MLGEFDQISKFMAPLAESAKGAFALTDDAAVFSHPENHEIVVTTDTLIAGVHFFADDPADLIAKKLLGVNLSDLAAMGAKPLHYTLNASYPSDISIEWIEQFVSGLADMQETYGIVLLGGDTTRTPGPLTLSLSAFGVIEQGNALRRTTAKPGDLLCVSGTIGDGALGLKVAQGHLKDETGFLLDRYCCPQPRTKLSQGLVGLATACMDISDGLLADMAHFNVGAEISLEKIPLSQAAKKAIEKDSSLYETILTGGDDYELLFSIKAADKEILAELARSSDTKVSIIGRISDNFALTVYGLDGQKVECQSTGYRHF